MPGAGGAARNLLTEVVEPIGRASATIPAARCRTVRYRPT
jgi:hypothetical protein